MNNWLDYIDRRIKWISNGDVVRIPDKEIYFDFNDEAVKRFINEARKNDDYTGILNLIRTSFDPWNEQVDGDEGCYGVPETLENKSFAELLKLRKGQCLEHALAFQLACQEAGLPCETIIGFYGYYSKSPIKNCKSYMYSLGGHAFNIGAEGQDLLIIDPRASLDSGKDFLLPLKEHFILTIPQKSRYSY